MVLAVVNRAGYQTVDFVLFQHQGAENHVVFQLLTRDRFGHAFVLRSSTATHIAFANHFRIDDFNAGAKLNALGRGYAVDLIRVTQQDAVAIPRRKSPPPRYAVRRLPAERHVCRLCAPARSAGSGRLAERDGGCARRSRSAIRSSRRDVVGHVFLNFLDTLVIVNRYFEVKALQAQGGLPVLVLTMNTGRPVAKARSHSLLMRASIS